MEETHLAEDWDVRFYDLYREYVASSGAQKTQLRDRVLDLAIGLHPDELGGVVSEFGPEAVYSRVNQLHKDLLSRVGYSGFEGTLEGYDALESIADANKGLSPKAGDGQVVLSSGQFTHSCTDLRVNGRGFPFSFTRVYKSGATYSGPLGANWDYTYNLWLRVEDGGMRVARSTGQMREDTYEKDDLGIYQIPNGSFSKLTEEVVILGGLNIGSRFILETTDGTKFVYKQISNQGLHKVEFIVDKYNNMMQFHYDLNNKGLLQKVQDTLGKEIIFTHDARNRIQTIEEDGRRILFCYDDNNNLKCCQGPIPEEGEEPAITWYEYGSHNRPEQFIHNIEAVIDGEGNRYIENEYGTTRDHIDYNRVVRQRRGLGDIYYDYYALAGEGQEPPVASVAKTVVKKRNDHIVEHVFDVDGNCLRRTDCATGVADLSAPISTSYRYNEDGRVIQVTSADGSITDYVYEREWHGAAGRGRPTLDQRRRFGNLLKVIRRGKNSTTIIAIGHIDYSNDIVSEFEYENLYNQVTARTDPRDNRRETKYIYSNEPRRPLASSTGDFNGAYLRRVELPKVTLPNGHKQEIVKEYEYNERGQLVLERNLRRTFIRSGKVEVLNDPEEVLTTYEYYDHGDERYGYLHRITKDNGHNARCLNITAEFDVDRYGNVISATDGKGNTTLFRYDRLGRQVETTLPRHEIKTRRYFDKNNRVVRSEQDLKDSNGDPEVPPPGLVVEMSYTCMDRLKRIETGMESGNESIISTVNYTVSDKPCLARIAGGTLTRYRYNERDLIKSVISAFSTPEASKTDYHYDVLGRVVQVIDGMNNITTFDYDEFGRVFQITDALENIATYQYDKLENIVSHSFVSADGQLLAKADFIYDEIGRLVETRDYWFNRNATDISVDEGLPAGATAVMTHFYLDEAGNLLRAVHDVGGLESIVDSYFDALNRPICTEDAIGNQILLQYDANSNVTATIRIEKAPNDSKEVSITETEYDELNRPTSIIDNLNNRTRLLHDSRGNLTWIENPSGNVVERMFDVYGRRIARIQRVNGTSVTTQYRHNRNGLVTEVANDAGKITLFRHDSLDRLVEIEYPDGSIERIQEYDKNSNIIRTSDCNGLVKTFTYDALNRLRLAEYDKSDVPTWINVLGPDWERFDYEARGRLILAENENGMTRLRYDSLGNLLLEDYKGNTIESSYDALGFRKRLVYPDGRVINLVPDKLGRLKSIEEQSGVSITKNSYIGPTRLHGREFKNGTMVAYRYDGARRPISIRYLKNGTELLEIQSLFDGAGNKCMENRLGGGSNADFFRYDTMSRLIEARFEFAVPRFNPDGFKPANSAIGISPTNDPLQTDIDALLGAPAVGGKRIEFELDTLGNRKTRKETGKQDIAYNSNELDQYKDVNGQTLFYDRNGNLVSDGNFRYHYDFKNRIARVEDGSNGDVVVMYSYDALGRRITKKTKWHTTAFIYDGQNVIEERDRNGQVLAQYVYGLGTDDIVQMSRGEKEYYFLKNSLGSTLALSDSTGSIVERYEFSPFGIVTVPSALGNPYLFAGKRFDYETSLYHSRARTYSPVYGRFLQRDPKGFIDSANLYSYAMNNPVSFVDPFGMDSIINLQIPYTLSLKEQVPDSIATDFALSIDKVADTFMDVATSMYDLNGQQGSKWATVSNIFKTFRPAPRLAVRTYGRSSDSQDYGNRMAALTNVPQTSSSTSGSGVRTYDQSWNPPEQTIIEYFIEPQELKGSELSGQFGRSSEGKASLEEVKEAYAQLEEAGQVNRTWSEDQIAYGKAMSERFAPSFGIEIPADLAIMLNPAAPLIGPGGALYTRILDFLLGWIPSIRQYALDDDAMGWLYTNLGVGRGYNFHQPDSAILPDDWPIAGHFMGPIKYLLGYRYYPKEQD